MRSIYADWVLEKQDMDDNFLHIILLVMKLIFYLVDMSKSKTVALKIYVPLFDVAFGRKV